MGNQIWIAGESDGEYQTYGFEFSVYDSNTFKLLYKYPYGNKKSIILVHQILKDPSEDIMWIYSEQGLFASIISIKN